MDLREQVILVATERYLGLLGDELVRMYHNGSMKFFPEDDAQTEFYEHWLPTEVLYLVEYIEETIEEKTGEVVQIWQYGRGGATFSTKELYKICGPSRSVDTQDWAETMEIPTRGWEDEDYTDEPEDQRAYGYTLAKTTHQITKIINDMIEEAVNGAKEAWDGYVTDYEIS